MGMKIDAAWIAAVVLLATMPGCVRHGPFGGRTGPPRAPSTPDEMRGRTAEPPRTPVAKKQVSGKAAPSTLIALDATRCTVTAERFRETHIGESVWCLWKP